MSTSSGSSVIEFDPIREREADFFVFMDRMIGHKLGKIYEITEYVCHGRSAGIMEGVCSRTGRKIIVKVSRPDDDLILHEVKVLRKLGWSPFVSQMLTSNLRGPNYRYFVSMQEKQSLWKYHLQNGALNLQQSLIVIHDVLRGLQFLHENRVVHRDVHPGNMVISADEATAVKLIDFGHSAIRKTEGDYEAVVDQTVCTPVFFTPLAVVQGKECVEVDDLHMAMLSLLKLRDSAITRVSLSEFHAFKQFLVSDCSATLPLEEEVFADVMTKVFEEQRYEEGGVIAKVPDHEALIRLVKSIAGFNPDAKF